MCAQSSPIMAPYKEHTLEPLQLPYVDPFVRPRGCRLLLITIQWNLKLPRVPVAWMPPVQAKPFLHC